MTVRELVGGEVVHVGLKDTIAQAAKEMAANGVGALAVVENGRLRGIITERDVVKACAEGADLELAAVSEWMTADPDSLDPDMSVEDAADWILAAGYRHLPVLAGDRLIGVVSIKDVLWALTSE